MTLLFAALALQLATAEPPAVRPKLLVLAFRDNGVGADAVGVIGETLVAHLSAKPGLEVTSSEDIRRAIDMQASKIELGCDEDTCMAEIAGALGAQLTMFGTAGRLGDLVVVSVNLFDARAGKSIGRETIEVASLADLPGPLRSAGDRLVARLTPEEPGPNPLFIGGTLVGALGLGAGIVGAVMWLPNIDGYADDTKNATFPEKSSSRFLERAGASFVGAGAGALVVGAALVGASFAFE